ncbi:unnamed protein product [Parnassius apollo]|uniref:(apollo) hypothetical protein n=1 Tax=Parnassius apollo TaxID=110799 RepID=A0A8S3X337_PARAO|nr:unnamed protein product [Parnassius apollo]
MPMVTNSIDDVKFTTKIVLKTLLTFDDATATGPDGIPSILLKRCSSLLAEYISSIMNKSMEGGRLPADWKKATVVPIYKNGDKMRPSNYRPISLTSILCKAMKKIITERLREFLLQEQLILDEQHGFVPKRSIITNMLQCVNEWVSNHDNGLPTDVIYLDYEKAFDRVPLRRLICKLKHFGIRGKLLA